MTTTRANPRRTRTAAGAVSGVSTRLERRRHRTLRPRTRGALAGDEGVVEPDGVGSNGGESGRPPFDPAFVADDDAFFVVADDAVFSISAGASERDEGASGRDGGASERLGDAETPLATSDDHDPFAPTALVRSGETALAVVSAAGGDAPSFSFASVSVSFASSFSFSGARLMTSKAAAPWVPTRAASPPRRSPPALVQPPRSPKSPPPSRRRRRRAADREAAAPHPEEEAAAPRPRPSRATWTSYRASRVPESEFRPDPEDRPVSAPGGGCGAFGSRARARWIGTRSQRPPGAIRSRSATPPMTPRERVLVRLGRRRARSRLGRLALRGVARPAAPADCICTNRF